MWLTPSIGYPPSNPKDTYTDISDAKKKVGIYSHDQKVAVDLFTYGSQIHKHAAIEGFTAIVDPHVRMVYIVRGKLEGWKI